MSSPPSLRDLYAAPPNSWSFNAAPANVSDAAAAAPTPGSYQWSARSSDSPNALLGLSGTVQDDEVLDAKTIAVGLVTAGLFQYAMNAVATPWEVGKTLLQVQWIPRDLEALPSRDLPKEVDEEDEVRVDYLVSCAQRSMLS